MGGACGTHGGKRSTYQFSFQNLKERDCLEDLGVDEKNNIKTDVRDSSLGCMDWFKLTEDKFKCWTLVNMLTFRCDKIARSFLASLLAAEGDCAARS
jgi:hypothetical protein